MNTPGTVSEKERASREWQLFLFIIVLLFPILSVAFVGGYGFFVWAMQALFFGPPGHG